MDRRRAHLASGTLLVSLLLGGCQSTTDTDPESPHPEAEPAAGSADPATEREEWLASYAAAHDIDPVPEVAVVHVVTPSESKAVVDECVVDQGWEQLPDSTFQYPSEQDQAFALAMYVCMASYPVDPTLTGPPDQDQWAAIYDYWMTETMPCLDAEGYELSEPPSRETFLASPTWSPDTPGVRDQIAVQVRDGTVPSHEHVFTEVCPVMPPDDVRYGGR